VGTRRIRVNAWLPDDPYPLADVDDWPDADPDEAALEDLVAVVAARVSRSAALAVELGDLVGDPGNDVGEVSDDPLLASYHLVALAPVGSADEYQLLCSPTPRARLEGLLAMLDDVDALQQFRLLAGDDDQGGLPD
jgi:Lon protease-like protein